MICLKSYLEQVLSQPNRFQLPVPYRYCSRLASKLAKLQCFECFVLHGWFEVLAFGMDVDPKKSGVAKIETYMQVFSAQTMHVSCD